MIKKFEIEGMTCSSCVASLEKGIGKLKGINKVNVFLMTNSMKVDYDEKIIDENKIVEAVKSIGYTVKGIKKEKDKKEHNKNMFELVFASFITLLLMYITMGGMIGLKSFDFIDMHKSPANYVLLQLLLTIPILFVFNKYFIKGFKSLIILKPNMDSLIAVSSGASFIFGVVSLFLVNYNLSLNNTEEVHKLVSNLYFESVVMILTFVSIGKYLEEKTKNKTSDSIRKLSNLAPKKVRVIRDLEQLIIDEKDLNVGDIAIIKEGETIASDGIIVKGAAYVDESMITGESQGIDKKINDKVIGGTIVQSGYIEMKITAVGSSTTLSRIIDLVIKANESKAPIARIADKIAGYFVPVVMAISLVTFVVWISVSKDINLSLNMGISVLVISCPCALGLATPVSIMAGTGKAAEYGILIKSGEAMEIVPKIDTILFDKTGTITKGVMEVKDILKVSGDEKSIMSIAVSLEQLNAHPLASAVTKYNDFVKAPLHKVEKYKSYIGEGLEGTINGEVYRIGNEKFINDFVETSNVKKSNLTRLFVASKEKLLGVIIISDVIKESSIEAIKKLKKQGIGVFMLTGDNEEVAKDIASTVGIDNVYAQLKPEQKENIVKELKAKGKTVAFVGDGINDAPSLAQSDVGIAVGGGTDIAIEGADIVLMKSDLNDVYNLLKISKKTIINIKENLFWAFFYNILGIPLAAGALYYPLGLKLSPMIGSLCMSLSSVFVVSNSLRLKLINLKKGEKKMINKYEVTIEGMACEHCVKRVKAGLEQLKPLTLDVSLKDKRAKLTFSSDISKDAIKSRVEEAGYEVVEIRKY